MIRPAADPAGPGQESVWNFPRPSIAQSVTAHLRIILGGKTIAETRQAIRTIETSHPPTYYIPTAPFAALADYVAFYAAPMDACFVDDEQVTPQPGQFYGGWITAHVVGPFKGAPGSRGW